MQSIHPRASSGHAYQEMDLSEPMNVQAVIHGTVQGVGFRYWTMCQARERDLVGHATNNPDGTVTVEVEGPRWAVGELLKTLNSNDTPGSVFKVDSHYGPTTGRFTEFSTH